MNKNFIFGSIFGIVAGLTIGFTTPMIAETVDIKLPSKKTNTTNKKNNSIYQELSLSDNKNASVDLTKVISLMKDIDAKLDKHTQQNDKMIEALNNLSKRFNPLNTPAK